MCSAVGIPTIISHPNVVTSIGQYECLNQQKSFMTNLKPSTEWFKNTKMEDLSEKIKELELYAEFITI